MSVNSLNGSAGFEGVELHEYLRTGGNYYSLYPNRHTLVCLFLNSLRL